jgi:hypothetical protein
MWKNSPFIQTPSARLPLANFTCTDEFAIGWVFSVVWIKVVPDLVLHAVSLRRMTFTRLR